MRVFSLVSLLIALCVGCAGRDTSTTARRNTTTPNASSSTTEAPRTTADRNSKSTPRVETTTRTETRSEETVNKPVIAEQTAGPDVDNTASNKRDADGDLTKTPIDQNENKKDIDITAAIRKRVTDTEASINAQNVKIITQDGKVTLRGPVKDENEKQMIERIAREIAGDGKVDNQLEVEKE